MKEGKSLTILKFVKNSCFHELVRWGSRKSRKGRIGCEDDEAKVVKLSRLGLFMLGERYMRYDLA